MLDGKPRVDDGEPSGENEALPIRDMESIRRLVDDSAKSLCNHSVLMAKEYQDIGDVFENY